MTNSQTTIAPAAEVPAYKYAAFLSYKREPDLRIATAVQSALHRLTKPWYRIRAMRIFRDKTDLSLSHKLWSSIRQGLEASEYFILLASPQAAGSEWVGKEVRYWAEERIVDKLLIVLTEGEIVWDARGGDFDWDQTSALPKDFRAIFTEEPNYLDLRWARSSESLSLRHPQFKEAMAELAARIQCKDKAEIIGEDVRQYRRAIRLAWAAVVTLVLLTLFASAAAVYASQQRSVAEARREEAEKQREEAELQRQNAEDQQCIAELRSKEERRARQEEQRQRQIADERRREAERQQQIAFARQISAQAEVVRNQALFKSEYADQQVFSDATIQWPNLMERSVLLSIEGFRRLPSLESEQALRGAVGMLPRTMTAMKQMDEDHAVFFSDDGKRMLIAASNGEIKLWDSTTKTYIWEKKLDKSLDINDFAFAPDGRYVAILEGERYVIWDIDGRKELWSRKFAEGARQPVFSSDGNLVAISDGQKVHVLTTITGAELRALSHGSDVTRYCFNPDGKRIATSEKDEFVRIWDISNGSEIAKFTEEAMFMTFSPDGRLLATTSRNKANIWDPNSGKLIQPIEGIPTFDDEVEYIVFARFSDDSSRLGTIGDDGTCQVWEVSTGRIAWVIGSAEDAIASLDGKYVMMKHAPGVEIWDVTTGKEVIRLIHHGDSSGFAFNSNSGLLAVVSDGYTKVYDTGSGQEVSRVVYKAPSRLTTYSRARKVVYHPDGKYVALGSEENISIWDITRAREVSKVRHAGGVNKMAFNQDGRFLATAGGDDTVRIWETQSGREVKRLGGIQAVIKVKNDEDEENERMNVQSVHFSPQGDLLEIETADGAIQVIHLIEGKEIARGRGAVFSSDGKYMAIQGDDLIVQIYDLITRKVIFSTPGIDKVQRWVFSDTGYRLAVINNNNIGIIYEVSEGREISRISFDTKVTSLLISPDGKWLATARQDGRIEVWDARTGQAIIRANHPGEPHFFSFEQEGRYLVIGGGIHGVNKDAIQVLDLKKKKCVVSLPLRRALDKVYFSPDEKYLVVITDEEIAQIVNLQTGRVIAKLLHENIVNNASFSPDGKYLATASSDKTARVWDIRNFREVARVTHDGEVFVADFTPNGRYLFTASDDQTSRVWLLKPEDLVEKACNGLTRNLSHQEWRNYFGAEPYHKTCKGLPSPTN